MYPVLHRILVLLYALLPIAVAVWAIYAGWRKRSPEPLISFIITCFSGILLGSAIVIIHIVLRHGRTSAWPVLQSWYFLTSLLCLMGALRYMARTASRWMVRIHRPPTETSARHAEWRFSVASFLQTLIMVAVGLPLVAATLLVHPVQVHSTSNPKNAADCDYENVSFPASDGVRIAGWWVPAMSDDAVSSSGPGTVLLCCDVANDLDRQAGLLRLLVSAGYNVLAFDLRGNGDSAGQWVSFGDVERRDVLGAVRWLKANHPEASEHLYGVGGGVGAAALIAAATDADPDGQSIEALAVFDTYADFQSLAQSIVHERLFSPLRPWALGMMLPIVSAHAGSDLAHFSPGSLAGALWPRPILVIHGKSDPIIPLSEGQDLLRAAAYPRQSLWLPGDQATVYKSRLGASVLLRFLSSARPLPAI